MQKINQVDVAGLHLSHTEENQTCFSQIGLLNSLETSQVRAAIARALGLGVPAPVRAGEGREPLRDSGAHVQTVLCARSVLGVVGYICRRPVLKTITRSHVCTFLHSGIRYCVHAMVC